MTPAARQIVFVNTAHTITHYSLLVLPTAVLAMAVPGGAFGESLRPTLALATGMFVLHGLLSLPQGWLAQRFGRKALMTAFFLGTGSGLVGAGLAHSPVMLAVALACAGGFAAIYHPIGTTMLIEAAGDKPGRSIGVNGVFGNLGVALAPVVTAFLANAVGWRSAFIAPGLVCAVAGLVWMRTPLAPPARILSPSIPAYSSSSGAPSRFSAVADRDVIGTGIQCVHLIAAEAYAGAAGRKRHPVAAGGAGRVPGHVMRRADAIQRRADD